MMRRSVVDAILSLTESNRFQRVSLPGSVLKPTIWTIQMSKGRLARPVGVLGNFFSTPLKGLLIFQISPDYSLCGRSPILFYFSVYDLFCCGADSHFGQSDIRLDLSDGCYSLPGGIQLLTIGILGKYISKIYLETKKRPLSYQRKSEPPDFTEK